MSRITSVLSTLLLSSISLTAQQTINATLLHDNVVREYIMYVPATYDPNVPCPLVLSYHGAEQSSSINFDKTRFDLVADTAGFIVVHPMGTLQPDEKFTHWNVDFWNSNTDDIGFSIALLDSIEKTYNIDPKRIYSAGTSNGGFMSYLLACQLSNRIAAIASVSGSLLPKMRDNCRPEHPTPVLQIHGTADSLVPYEEKQDWVIPAFDAVQYWVEFNNCDSIPSILHILDIDTLDGSTVKHFIHGNGKNGVSTELFKVVGGGHAWPGKRGNMDMNSTLEIWRFFSKYNIDGLIETR